MPRDWIRIPACRDGTCRICIWSIPKTTRRGGRSSSTSGTGCEIKVVGIAQIVDLGAQLRHAIFHGIAILSLGGAQATLGDALKDKLGAIAVVPNSDEAAEEAAAEEAAIEEAADAEEAAEEAPEAPAEEAAEKAPEAPAEETPSDEPTEEPKE